jgi:hypothetical protein
MVLSLSNKKKRSGLHTSFKTRDASTSHGSTYDGARDNQGPHPLQQQQQQQLSIQQSDYRTKRMMMEAEKNEAI